MTQVALATNRPKVTHERQDAAKREFVYHLSRADYERQFGNKYRRPGFFARVLGFLIKLIPFGPAKILGYRNPTPQAEDNFFRSMDKAMDEYHLLLRQVRTGNLDFPNRNFDTGRLTRAGEYALSDRTYVAYVERLRKDHYRHLTPSVKADVLAYFSQGIPANGSIKNKDWKKLNATLQELQKQIPVEQTAGVDQNRARKPEAQ
jgi:hypothetical protein